MPKVLYIVYAVLFACLVWAVGTSVYLYDQHRHEHTEEYEGQVFRKDDVVVDAVKSFQRPGREKVVCYRESHRNFYIFIFQMTLGILAVTAAGVAVNVRLNRRLQRKNGEISEQKTKLEAQKAELEVQKRATDEANAQVMASLRYASTLQTGLLMRHEDLQYAHPDAFLLNRPKAGIGGDFCYMFGDDEERILCVGDCTGHGVPGAILAVLAFTLIRQIVEEGLREPAQILEVFLTRFTQRLNHGENDDKAELMVCRLRTADGLLDYASNGARVFWTDGQEHLLIEGQGQTCLPKTGYLYGFSDGYPDQLGGPEGKRLLRKRFLGILEQAVLLPAPAQAELLLRRLREWQGNEVQTDDVLVLGWPLRA